MTNLLGRERSAERAQFLADTLTCAVEGGINYWAQVSGYRWWYPDLDGGTAEHRDGIANAYARVHDAEGSCACELGGWCRGHLVTLDDIARGWRLFSEKKYHPGSYSTQGVLANRTNGEDGDVDADIADRVLQLALFGEEIYG